MGSMPAVHHNRLMFLSFFFFFFFLFHIARFSMFFFRSLFVSGHHIVAEFSFVWRGRIFWENGNNNSWRNAKMGYA